MWNVMTLDGYFEGSRNWDLSFHEIIWGEEVSQIGLKQLRSADFLVFGRVAFEGMAAHWKKEKGETAVLMNELPKIVFSRTLEKADWRNSTLIKENPSAKIRELKQQGDGDMFVFGSAILSETLMKDDLFDEYRLVVAPVILGEGRPLFSKGIINKKLTLISAQTLSTGGVILIYGK